MLIWKIIWLVLSWFFAITTFLPSTKVTHWFFRIFDFIRIQAAGILFLLLVAGLLMANELSILGAITLGAIVAAIVMQMIVILPYMPKKSSKKVYTKKGTVVVSSNVKESNEDYQKVIDLVEEVQPDIFITLETNKKWERELSPIEKYFEHSIKVPKENRYGIHLFTKLKLKESKVHYLIDQDYPSVEAHFETEEGKDFILWVVHPPPPSPTEKPTSRQKDGELMQLAKIIVDTDLPTIVVGDFNNVCWSSVSKLFSKYTKLIDARIGRGFHGTFPANFKLLRFPIDLVFHSKSLHVNKLKTLTEVGSDHLPLLSEFHFKNVPEPNVNPDQELKEEAEEKIKEGKKAAKEENEN